MHFKDLSWLLSISFCSLLLAAPFCWVTIPPITDLPQQTAQVRLLLEALENPQGPYTVQWADPNKLGYLPLLLSWWTIGPQAAGKVTMVMIGILWVVSLHWLAKVRGRSLAAAALGTLFFFNHTHYWGFLNFSMGLPVFILWWLELRRFTSETEGWAATLRFAFLAALLYSAHVLWLAVGLLHFFFAALYNQKNRRSRSFWFSRGLALAPTLIALALWYPKLAAGGFDSETTWGHTFIERLHPQWLLNSALGGLQSVEGALLITVVFWLLLGIWQHRRVLWDNAESRAEAIDQPLLVTAALFLTAALTLPSVHQHTIFFASRWVPPAAVFLLLALPWPKLKPLLNMAFSVLLVASLSAATSAAWIGFENEELDGLHAALNEVPPDSRILGLDFVRTSNLIQGFPFYHFYTYAQVWHGSEVSRSFANEASSLVVWKDIPRELPWNDGLDWRAEQVRKSDIDHFDAVLVHGGRDRQAVFLADPRLRPVTPEKRWRLFRKVQE